MTRLNNTAGESSRLREVMQALAELSHMTLQQPLDYVLEQAAQTIKNILGVLHSEIWLYDADYNTLVPVSERGSGEGVRPRFGPMKAFTEGAPVRIECRDALASELPPGLDPTDLQCVLHFPIIGHDATKGVLSLYHTQPVHPDNDQTLCVNCVSTFLAQALDYEQMKQSRRRSQQRERDYIHAMQVLEGELASLSYAISHDLDAPVRAVQGFGRAVLEDYGHQLDEEGQMYLERLCAAGDQIEMMIAALVDLSRIARSPLIRQPLELHKLVQEVAEDISASYSKLHIDWKIAPDKTVNADKQLMLNLLHRLLENAARFANGQSLCVEFGQTLIDGQQTCFIRDDGIGFDSENATRLFTPFQRMHTSAERAGIGVGLAAARRIVHRHGGRIWIESAPGRGTSVYFTLPESGIAEENA